MAAVRKKTAERGLGGAHQAARKAALKALPPGTICPRCPRPMFADPQMAAAAGLPPRLWPLDLDDFPGRVFGGPQVKLIAHRFCNRRAGQRLTTRILAARRVARQPARYDRW